MNEEEIIHDNRKEILENISCEGMAKILSEYLEDAIEDADFYTKKVEHLKKAIEKLQS